MLSIVHIPNSVLLQRARPVGHIDKKILRLIKDMEDALDRQTDPQGVGLAAPQVGVALQLFIMRPSPDSVLEVCINPQILKLEGKAAAAKRPVTKGSAKARKSDPKLEGCLSIPRIWAPVERYPKLLLSYQDQEGREQKQWFSGFRAIIVQHEVDHLNGILFTQRALEQKMQIYEEQGDELKKVDY